jgi:hypothetical protein
MKMQHKSTRGVQQEDVWLAADQLVGEGLRPTIERVRLKLGRGSPNTVSPMLDGWFATLGARLGVGGHAQLATNELPVEMRQLASKLWETALLEAKTVADQRLMDAQHILDAAHVSIGQRELDLALLQQGLQDRQITQDELLRLARSQVADLGARLEQASTLVNRRDVEIDSLQLKLTHLDTQRAADQRSTQEQFQHHAQERLKLEEHARITERRLMTELDRERQETKRLRLNLEKSEQRVETLTTQFQGQLQAQAQKQLDIEQALRSERHTSLAAQQRASELRDLLGEQVKENTLTQAQLSQLLLAVSAKSGGAEKPGRRIKVKPTQARSS